MRMLISCRLGHSVYPTSSRSIPSYSMTTEYTFSPFDNGRLSASDNPLDQLFRNIFEQRVLALRGGFLVIGGTAGIRGGAAHPLTPQITTAQAASRWS